MVQRHQIRHHRTQRILRRLRRWSGERLPRTFPAGSITFLPDPGAFFEAFFAALAIARQTICLEYYIVRADQTGNRLAEALIAARQRGVQIYLLYDYIGCLDTPESFFRRLRQYGIHCVPFNPPSVKRWPFWFDRRDHRKLAIIDGMLAFLGGRNIGDEYAGIAGGRRDFHDVCFSLTGPSLQHLSEIFAETWSAELGTSPDLPAPQAETPALTLSGAGITLISGSPHHRRSSIRSAFRVTMAAATIELLIANPYFIPGPRILRSLLRAARRGVQVKLLLPAESDVPLVRLVSRSTYEQLLKAGIEIYEMQQQILHAKLMVVDGCRTVIGSANLDQRSFHRNYEINAIVQSKSFGKQVRDHLQQDLAQARRITLPEHDQRGLAVRLVERLLRPLCWFL